MQRRCGPYLHRVSATIARGKRPVPSRTRKLSLSAPMVLRGPLRGRVGRRRTQFTTRVVRFAEQPSLLLCFVCVWKGGSSTCLVTAAVVGATLVRPEQAARPAEVARAGPLGPVAAARLEPARPAVKGRLAGPTPTVRVSRASAAVVDGPVLLTTDL